MPHAAAAMSRRDGNASDQQQDRQRIEQDAEREAARAIDRPVEPPAADARQQQHVEHECRRGQRGRLPPRQHAQQQREQTRADVHPLPRALGMRVP